MRALRYSVEEALASLWRGRHAAFLSTGTIALALFVLGGFLMGTTNLERLATEWSRAAELSVYLTDEITDVERATVETALASSAVVDSREYVSKDAALARFRETFGDLAGSVDANGRNPLPASYEVRLKSERVGDTRVEALAAVLRQAAGVADVRYDQEWLARLLSAIALVRRVGFMVGAVFSFAAALTVASVVRLGLHARRDELDIMQLVGAPGAYVRGPFVVEGVLQGGIGAIVALLALAVAFLALKARYLTPLAAAINLSSVHFLPFGLSALLVLGGMAVGCLGGVTAAWRRPATRI
jgi:cell division transport system permease protein